MTRTRILAALAAGVLTVGGGVAVAAPTSAAGPTSVPGPKQPIEHLGMSGDLFQVAGGNPACYGSGGTRLASFPVPRGALVTGVTAYVVDGSATAGSGVDLMRHSLDSGASYWLGSASTAGAPGDTTMSVELDPGVLMAEASSLNVYVRVGKANCLKGAEVHFIRNGAAVAPPTGSARAPEPTATAVEPDGALR